jgi:hypothetical protein
VLRSATQLFAQARNAITRCVQLSTGQTLFDLYKEIKDALCADAARLQDRLPKALAPTAPAAAKAPGLGLPGGALAGSGRTDQRWGRPKPLGLRRRLHTGVAG